MRDYSPPTYRPLHWWVFLIWAAAPCLVQYLPKYWHCGQGWKILPLYFVLYIVPGFPCFSSSLASRHFWLVVDITQLTSSLATGSWQGKVAISPFKLFDLWQQTTCYLIVILGSGRPTMRWPTIRGIHILPLIGGGTSSSKLFWTKKSFTEYSQVYVLSTNKSFFQVLRGFRSFRPPSLLILVTTSSMLKVSHWSSV